MTPAADDLEAERLIREAAVRELRRLDFPLIGSSTCAAARWRQPSVVTLPWQEELGACCDDIRDRALAKRGIRATFTAPPRHGKTEHVGIALSISCYVAAVKLGRGFSIIYATAVDERAGDVSRQVRATVEELYRVTKLKAYEPGEKWTETEWETKGGLRWKALGAGASTGGIGCHLLICDDMIGKAERYRSKAQRESVIRAFEEDYLSRVEDGGSVAVMETRRGIHDVIGHIRANYGQVWRHRRWKHYTRGAGYLWPQRYGETWRAMNPHLTDSSAIWRSLHQGEPVPEGGTPIEAAWLEHTYPEPPEALRDAPGSIVSIRVIGGDLAATGKTSSDPFAFVVLAARGAYRDVLEVVTGRASYVEQRRILKDLAAKWRPAAIVIERAANGDALVDELRSEISGIRGESATADKLARLIPWLALIAAGQLRLPAQPTPWRSAFRAELLAFTGQEGGDDAQVDALVWALVAAATGETPMTEDEIRAAMASVAPMW